MTDDIKQTQFNTYQDYVDTMTEKIDNLMTKLNKFTPNDSHGKKMLLSSEIHGLIMDLGSGLTSELKYLLNIQVPTQYKLLDDLLSKVNVENTDTLFLMSFIRGTSQAKKELKNWIKLRDDTAEKLTKEGRNTKQIMIGLY